MKKKRVVVICVLAVVVLLVVVGFRFVPKKQKLGDVTACLATVDNGNYIGKCENGIVAAKVEVTVEDHEITGVKILEHRNGKGQDAESVTDEVVDRQSVKVDTVSGATYSSYTILKAIENAIENATK